MFLQKSSKQNLKLINNIIFKTYDTHYLNFINHRKKRDCLLYIEMLRHISQNGLFDQSFLQKLNLKPNVIKIKKQNIFIKDNIKQIKIDNKKNILREMEFLKTIEKFITDTKNKTKIDHKKLFLEDKKNKIKFLTDEQFLSQISSNDEFCKKIISTMPKIEKYENIKQNKKLFDSLKYQFSLDQFDK